MIFRFESFLSLLFQMLFIAFYTECVCYVSLWNNKLWPTGAYIHIIWYPKDTCLNGNHTKSYQFYIYHIGQKKMHFKHNNILTVDMTVTNNMRY